MNGLLIHPVWLEEIFLNGKIWEIRRGAVNMRGKIYLLPTKNKIIAGEAVIKDCIKLNRQLWEENFPLHKVVLPGSAECLPWEMLLKLNPEPYAWVMSDIYRYLDEIERPVKKGQQKWCSGLPEDINVRKIKV